MASTSYLTRVIIKKHSTDNDFSGSYNLLVKSKSVPSPVGTRNEVESTTLEDDEQTFERGIKTSNSVEVTGNLEKSYYDAIRALEGEVLNIIHLYGTDGIGGVAKIAYTGYADAAPSDVGGTDEILEMTTKLIKKTTSKVISDSYTVVDNGDGTFTVAAAA